MMIREDQSRSFMDLAELSILWFIQSMQDFLDRNSSKPLPVEGG